MTAILKPSDTLYHQGINAIRGISDNNNIISEHKVQLMRSLTDNIPRTKEEVLGLLQTSLKCDISIAEQIYSIYIDFLRKEKKSVNLSQRGLRDSLLLTGEMLKKYNILRISKEIFHLARNTNNSKEDIEDIIVNYRYSLNNQPSRLPAIKNFKFIVNTLKVTDCAKLYKWHNILHAKPENLLTIVNDAKITDLYELATLRRLMGDNVSNKKLKIIINEQGVSDFEQLKRLALYFSLAHSRQDEKVERTINDGKYDPARQYTLREYAKDLKIQTFIGEESMNDFYQLKRLLYAEGSDSYKDEAVENFLNHTCDNILDKDTLREYIEYLRKNENSQRLQLNL